MRSVVVVVALAVVLLAGCTSGAAAPTLDGSSWELTGWSDAGSDPRVFKITASLARGQIAGKSGVNNYFGPYTAGPGDKFSVGPTGSTMMAGPPKAMQAEQTYFRLLGEVRAWHRTGKDLILSDSAGKVLLTFSAAL